MYAKIADIHHQLSIHNKFTPYHIIHLTTFYKMRYNKRDTT